SLGATAAWGRALTVPWDVPPVRSIINAAPTRQGSAQPVDPSRARVTSTRAGLTGLDATTPEVELEGRDDLTRLPGCQERVGSGEGPHRRQAQLIEVQRPHPASRVLVDVQPIAGGVEDADPASPSHDLR